MLVFLVKNSNNGCLVTLELNEKQEIVYKKYIILQQKVRRTLFVKASR